ncbi:HDIG domain-containing protein [bacterium]|nr:HDIG domain-containing protein [bacterium]
MINLFDKVSENLNSKIEDPVIKARFDNFANVGLLLVLGLIVTILLTFNLDQLPQHLSVGSVAIKDIKADQNYEIIDALSTQKLKLDASQAVRPVYDYDPLVSSKTAQKISEAFLGSRQFLIQNAAFFKGRDVLDEALEFQLRSEFQEALGGIISDDAYALFRKYRFNGPLEKALITICREMYVTPVILNKSELESVLEKGFTFREKVSEGNFAEVLKTDANDIVSLDDVMAKMEGLKTGFLRDVLHLEFLTSEHFTLLKNVSLSLLKPSLVYNAAETDARRSKATEHVNNIVIKVKRGESIVRSGDRFEPWHLTVLEGIRKAHQQSKKAFSFLGVFLFVNLVLAIVYYYASKYIRKFKPNRKDLVFLGTSLLFFLILLRVSVFMASSIKDAFPFSLSVTTLYYAIPIAGGAMLVRFILNSETALIFSIILSLFSGIFLESNLEMTVYYMISGVFAAHAIAYVDKRSSVLYCGVLTGLVNALVVYSMNLINLGMEAESVAAMPILLNALSGFLGGIFTSIIVLALTTVTEVIFNYTTDIKLLELASLSHPLLKEMIWKAPGTYHHSQLVGILSEAAAQAIGANPLFARVASYYHDIGKMKKPQYFIENQKGINPHDKLSPSMSALIIAAHVSDGIAMAKEFKLPQKITDMIPQHQGTKLIGFFYEKAKKLADPTMDKVDERDYRYEGPKPQTKEAGIIMLADTVEAAVRALPEKSPHKIQATVEKLINMHFVDEQLDECDLTLKDLHQIANAFVKILSAIYHQRIEYPENTAEGNDNNGPYPPQLSNSLSNVSPLFRKKPHEGA